MKTIRKAWIGAAMVLALSCPSFLQAQQQPATVHGHANDEIGNTITDGEVKFTKDLSTPADKRKYDYTFAVDANGNYTGTGIAPGTYLVNLFRKNVSVDFFENQTFKPGEDKTLNFDLSRPDYIAKLTPERRKEIEEYRAKNQAAMSTNKVIASLNATLKTTREDLNGAKAGSGDVSKDVTAMKAAVDAKPDESLLWITYGDTLLAQGDHMAKDDRDAKKAPTSDDAVVKEYTDAADAYKKGVDLNASSKKPIPGDQAIAYNQMGNALARAGKYNDSVAAFESAAKADPSKAGMYYNNEAAVMFNNNKIDEALAAANKAIAADPNRPDPYFIKGQALVQHATVDPKTQLPVAPPGCLEAYQKYLALAPDGPHADTVKEILTSFGQKIDTRYNAKKK